MNKNNPHTPQSLPSTSRRARERLHLKVCGMKYKDNIAQVAALQPDYLGFIFYEKSTRYFDLEHISKLPKSIKKTGVFVDADINFVIEKIKKHDLQAVQLHGEESPEYCQKLKTRVHTIGRSGSNKEVEKQNPFGFNKNIEIIKVFSIKDEFNFHVLKPFEGVCDYFLFDTKGKLPGGNGYTFNWSVLNNYPSTKPFFLSGGIGIEQVSAIKQFEESKASTYCFALDVNSKFEIEPGLKNISILKEFKGHVITKLEK